MSKKEIETIEDRKASVVIRLRNYKLLKKEKQKEGNIYLIEDTKEKQKAVIWCLPEETPLSQKSITQMQKIMKETEVEKGIMITGGKVTQTIRQAAKKKNIELLAKTFPAFDIFAHQLVPKHEILTEEEIKELLKKYKIQPYQLPQIKASDPAVKAIDAKPGDILKIIRRSPTAGEHIAYRYVVE